MTEKELLTDKEAEAWFKLGQFAERYNSRNKPVVAFAGMVFTFFAGAFLACCYSKDSKGKKKGE